MARRIEVDIVGDASSLQRAFRETANGAQRFEAKVTGSMHNIARSAVVAAGAFVGFSAAGEAFKTVIGAAVDAERSSRQLAAQLKANGENFRANKRAIDEAGLSLGKYGFTIEDSEKALTVLDRGTKRITESIRLQSVAANLARAKNMDLAGAAAVLAKVFGGQETALRRAVPGLDKHAHGLELIAEASQRLAGQARAGTTAEERFHAILHDTEVTIGTALLPTVNKYLDRLSAWLDRMNRSGRLQRDVNQAMQTATAIIGDLKAVIDPLITAFKDLSAAVGGTKNAVKLLIAALLVFKSAKILNSIADTAAGIRGVGTAAETSTGQVAKLRLAILAIPTLAITDLLLGKKALTQQAVSAEDATGGTPFRKGTEPYYIYQAARRGKVTGTLKLPGGGTLPINWRKLSGQDLIAQRVGYLEYLNRGPLSSVLGTNLPAGQVGGAGVYNPPLTAYQRLQMGLAADPTNVSLLRQQIQHDQAALNFLEKLHNQHRITNKQYLAEYAAYYSDINSTLGTIASVTKQAARAGRHAAIHLPNVVGGTGPIPGLGAFARTERQSLLGGFQAYARTFGPIGNWQVPMGLQIAQARAGAFGTTQDQDNVLRRIRAAAIRALHSGRLMGQAWIDVYNTIAGINAQLGRQAGVANIKFKRSPAYNTAGVGGTVVIHGGVHLHGVQDMTAMENELEARAKRRPRPRRGR
jgi:hypothetical protein